MTCKYERRGQVDVSSPANMGIVFLVLYRLDGDRQTSLHKLSDDDDSDEDFKSASKVGTFYMYLTDGIFLLF